ncbi:translocation/assembly module TamB [Phocaeicola sp.]|uniref:translocation/assembly module TamB n=1 Tax=Phocaeicola sp. TaxID=2773926 RepID=UPI0023D29C3F|nr:translocation/assembly module TamB [Phocaeicola sp.]MDE5676375.1 translocation/assembly module TamB [Phocaeicola sp.]
MISSKSLKYTVRILLGTLAGVYLGFIVLLNIPYVQSKLSVFVAKELQAVLHTEVSVGRIDMGLLNRIIVEDVLLHDRHDREMLKVARLSAKFDLLPLLKGKITISSIQLFGFAVNMNRATPASPTNFQFLLDALASKDTVKTRSNLDLRINSILIRRGRMAYDVWSEPKSPGRFNANHLYVKNLAATISLKALRNDSLNATIRRISFEEQSGLELQKFSMKVTANNNVLNISNFGIELSNSALSIDSLVVRYDSLPELPRWTENVAYSGRLTASVVLKDLTPLVPALSRFEEPIELDLAFAGHGKNLDCPALKLTNHHGMALAGEAALSNWDAGMNMYIYGKLGNLNLTQEGINFLASNLTGSVPPLLKHLDYLRFNGEAAGYLRDITLTGVLHSGVGTIKTDLMMSIDRQNMSRTYSGSVASANLDLGKLLGKEAKFGRTDFNVELKGFNYKNHYPESYIKGKVSSFQYSGYQYENILLDGVYKDGGFNGRLSMNDENGSIQIDGNFNVAQATPDFNLKASVKQLRPYDLHLSDSHEGADISLDLTADFTGSSIDDMNGRISLDHLRLNAPDGGDYSLDNLTVTAGQVNGKKELRVHSSFLEAVVRGDYSYHTIPASIINTVQRYIPSLLTIKENMPQPHNNFLFDIRLKDAEALSKLFRMPLELHLPATLKGYFNDIDEKLHVEGYFPEFDYNGTHYDSGVLLCENPSDRFSCSLRGGMLLKSGAMLNFSVKANARNDRLETTVDWGNNTDVTYGGKFAANTRFFKTEGHHPILQADIEIQPTRVVLNDTVWNIHPAHIAVDSGRVFIDNFLFEHKDQYLRIDGKLTQKETDSCQIDLKNIRLDYVLDIVQFDDVEFGGLVTGKVHLNRVLKEPVMQTRLNVNDFRLNRSLLGQADITGIWDQELGGVRLDARIAEKGISATHVTGYVSPKLKGLDLMIRADSTNVGFLQPFVEGIFSELDGRVNGNVRLYGDFKHLDLEGEVRARMDARIDVLNTYFQIHDDSIHIASGSIDFRNVKVYDREGHKGLVNGYLHHTKLKNLMYRFNIRGDNLLMYNTHEAGDMPFYGKVYGTGNVVLNGGNNAMTVDASLTTANDTRFTYITGVTTEATSNQFITFVDKTPKRIHDNVETNLYHHSNVRQKEEEDGPPMDLHINMMIEATPNATMKIIMDPIAGDNITATGNGNLQVNYFNKGDFRMFGSYVIEQGLYKLSMQEVIRKDFALKSGGTVTFSGDPYQANLDLQAVYTVNSASLSDLIADPTRNQGTVKVNCLMNLTGNLSDPDIKFDLDLPTVKEEDRELVRSATSTEEQMNTQIIYLLGIGKFYTYDYANNDQSSNATSSLAFSTLSGQLNNMLSQWVDSKNWNIGANLSTGEKGWTDVEAEAMLSGRLLNNRLIINGNFGYKENVMANSNFVGDFEAIWLLTKNGDFRLRGYNQTNDRYFTKSTLTTQGVGIMYKKDFNTWDELFRWFLWKRRKDKAKKDAGIQTKKE